MHVRGAAALIPRQQQDLVVKLLSALVLKKTRRLFGRAEEILGRPQEVILPGVVLYQPQRIGTGQKELQRQVQSPHFRPHQTSLTGLDVRGIHADLVPRRIHVDPPAHVDLRPDVEDQGSGRGSHEPDAGAGRHPRSPAQCHE